MREKIIGQLVAELQKHRKILACFEGGSAAFNRADEWSDIDLQVVVKDDYVEKAVGILEKFLKEHFPIEEKIILPQPTWHGHWQGFYRFKQISPYLLLDILIMKESSKSFFTETEMHGTPLIYFDQTGRVGKEHIDLSELQQVINSRLERAGKVCRMFHRFVDKEIARQREPDAFDMYYGMILRTLVELLRIKYDPARWSFGSRYLSSVLPVKLYSEVKTYFYITDLADLAAKKKRVMDMINTLLADDLANSKALKQLIRQKSVK